MTGTSTKTNWSYLFVIYFVYTNCINSTHVRCDRFYSSKVNLFVQHTFHDDCSPADPVTVCCRPAVHDGCHFGAMCCRRRGSDRVPRASKRLSQSRGAERIFASFERVFCHCRTTSVTRNVIS